MPAIKNALLRYRIIDRSIRNEYNPYPTKEQLRQACEEEIYGTSEGLHICHSTIEKDIFAMRMEHDAPIAYSKREKGYYYTNDEFTMDDVPLTEKDISAIKAASTILHQFKSTSLFSQYQFAIDKILDRAVTSQQKFSNTENNIQFETLPTISGNEYLESVLEAIKKRNVLQFEYYNYIKDVKTIRRVHPYLLKEYRNRWYLIGKSELKNKVITFGLDRISNLQTLENLFSVDPSFNPDYFFQHSIGITVFDEKPQEIIIKTNNILSKYLTSQPLHHSQKLSKVHNNGDHLFSYFLLVTYELKMTILGYGSDCEVITPLSLREQIAEEIKKVASKY